MQNIQSYRRHGRSLLVLGLPLVGSHLAQHAIMIVDQMMLGWYAAEALAAATLALSVSFVVFIVGSGFAFAVLPVVASAAAAKNEVDIRRVTRMGMWISALYGLLVLPFYIWAEPILLALGQRPRIAELSADYLHIFCIGLVPALLVMVLKSYLAALERTQAVFWITVVAVPVNAVLNYALIFGNFGAPELGLRGAAIASVLVQLATLGLTVVYIQRVFGHHSMFQRIWRPDPGAFAKLLRLGLPIGLTNLAESGLFTGAAIMMGWLGTIPLAAHGIVTQLASITFVLHLGLSQAATVRAGQAFGAKDLGNLRQGALVASVVSALIALVTVVVFVVLPEPLVALFLDPTDPDLPQITAIAVTLLAIAALFQLVDGAQVIALGVLRGMQDTQIPMIHAGISYWGIGLPAGYVLGFVAGWGAVGIWLGLVVGLGAAALLLMHRFWTRATPALWDQPA